MSGFAPTDEQVERTARMLFTRTKEGRDGFTWPINGDFGRKRDIEDAQRFLAAVFDPPPTSCPACGHNWALHVGACCYYCTCLRKPAVGSQTEAQLAAVDVLATIPVDPDAQTTQTEEP